MQPFLRRVYNCGTPILRLDLWFPSQSANFERDSLVTPLTPVFRKVDNAIHRINHYQADSVICFVRTSIHWIAIYPVHLSNSWACPTMTPSR